MRQHKSQLSKIVALDPYNKTAFRLRGAEIKSLPKVNFSNEYDYISHILTKDMIVQSINLDFGINIEDIAGAIEDVAYDELGLDADKTYIIRYLHTSQDNNSYQVFIIEKNKLDAILSNVDSNVQYIDNVMPAPLAYRVLYDDLLDDKGVHCFIYFMKNDAFITFYKNGEYVYAKSNKYSLDAIYAQYVENGGDSMSQESFMHALNATKKSTDPDFQTRIMRIFGDAFISFNDIMVYAKRVNGFEKIDRLYIGSSAGVIAGLSNFSENYFGLNSFAMRFNFGFHSKNKNVDQFTRMLLEKGANDSREQNVNFSQQTRPPAIHKRASGHLIGVLISAAILGIIPSAYHFISKKVADGQKSVLLEKERKLSDVVGGYKRLIQDKNKNLITLKTELNKTIQSFTNKEKTLVSIYDKKVNYRLKSEQFSELAKDLGKFNIKTYDFKSSNDSYYLFLIAKSDKSITELIAYISKKYGQNIEFINISIITRDEEQNGYQGLLRVDFK